MIYITKQQAKNYLVGRSFLVHKASSILEVLTALSCIQVDPISVVAKSHELSLFNRVENFKIGDLETELYTNNTLFEYWMQLYSIIPATSFPYLQLVMQTSRNWHEGFYAQHKNEIDAVYDFIKQNGETSYKEIAHIPKITPIFSFTDKQSNTAALNYLWDRGQVVVSKRVNNKKFYNVTTQVLPAEILNIQHTIDESKRFILEANFDYLGFIRKAHLSKIGFNRFLDIKTLFEQMLIDGEIVKVKIESTKADYFILKRQLEQFKSLSEINMHDIMNLLPPLDPLIIDRQMLKDIFDFDYTWEAYVPASKRKFGYYGMPILHRGEFIGQIDLKKDKNGRLSLLNLELKNKNKDIKKAMKIKIDELEAFIGT